MVQCAIQRTLPLVSGFVTCCAYFFGCSGHRPNSPPLQNEVPPKCKFDINIVAGCGVQFHVGGLREQLGTCDFLVSDVDGLHIDQVCCDSQYFVACLPIRAVLDVCVLCYALTQRARTRTSVSTQSGCL